MLLGNPLTKPRPAIRNDGYKTGLFEGSRGTLSLNSEGPDNVNGAVLTLRRGDMK